ncbi:MAG: phenylalanine--tRNA ligase subunit beta [Pseudomonadota bacterium]
MKITLSWLKDYLETEASLEEITERLSMLGLVVDDVTHPGRAFKDFSVAEVIQAGPHPNADRLKVCQVKTGKQTLEIVCGAPNAHTGMKAVLAPIGAVIPATGKALKLGKIRDVESQGMLCSTFELGLAEQSDGGIMELDADAPVGAPFAQYLGIDDPVIDIEITPNRGDCLGAYGLARDLAVSGLGTLKTLQIPEIAGQFKSDILVEIDPITTDVCTMFAGRLICGVKNCPSPDWLQHRLRAIGLRPISALVDVTNYLAYDLGRPMHVFDADKLSGNLNIRFAKTGEKIQALDDKEYNLDDSMIVVADRQQAHSVAGVIGGEESGCTLETTNVFVESAVFDALSITMTGRKLNILTDSRYRFERGVDANQVIPAMEKATAFILEHCGGEVSEIEIAGSLPKAPVSVAFRPDRVKELVGIDVPKAEIAEILSKLGFGLDRENFEKWNIAVPTWRHDVAIEADLVEEVVRIHGYNDIHSIPLPKPGHTTQVDKVGSKRRHRSWAVRRALASHGMNEALTWSFLQEDRAKLFGGGSAELKLINPISADLSDMRPSLLPNLIDACQRNHNQGRANTALFEIGPQFYNTTPDGQQWIVAGVRSGENHRRHWQYPVRPVDVYDAKSDALEALKACGINVDKVQIVSKAPNWYHSGRCGTLCLGPKNTLAYFGELHPATLKSMEAQGPMVGFEVMLQNLPSKGQGKGRGGKKLVMSPYQPVERDFAFVVDQDIAAGDVIKAVRKAESKLITDVTLFDLYQGKGVPEGKKSLALSVRLEPQQATLTDAEIAAVCDKIVAQVASAVGGELRG